MMPDSNMHINKNNWCRILEQNSALHVHGNKLKITVITAENQPQTFNFDLDQIVQISREILNGCNEMERTGIQSSLSSLHARLLSLNSDALSVSERDFSGIRTSILFFGDDLKDLFTGLEVEDTLAKPKEQLQAPAVQGGAKAFLRFLLEAKTISVEELGEALRLVQEEPNLLFQVINNEKSLIQLLMLKCTAGEVKDFISEIYKDHFLQGLSRESLLELNTIIFETPKKGDRSVFEFLMSEENAPQIFDAFLHYFDITNINFEPITSSRKSQLLNFGYSLARYNQIFVNSENEIANRLSIEITRFKVSNFNNVLIEIKQFKYTAYEKWIQGRASCSTTITGTTNEASLSTRNWIEANDYISKLCEERKHQSGRVLTLVDINQVHLVLTKEEVDHPGVVRTVVVHCGAGATSMPAPPKYLDPLLRDFENWFNDGIRKCDNAELSPVVFAAETYQRFVSYHPYENGNGRISRLLMDFVLERYDIPPPLLPKEEVLDAIFPFNSTPDIERHVKFVGKVVDGIQESKKVLGIE